MISFLSTVDLKIFDCVVICHMTSESVVLVVSKNTDSLVVSNFVSSVINFIVYIFLFSKGSNILNVDIVLGTLSALLRFQASNSNLNCDLQVCVC